MKVLDYSNYFILLGTYSCKLKVEQCRYELASKSLSRWVSAKPCSNKVQYFSGWVINVGFS